ncbi:MAG: helix-turn-helix domain-containing protein, partial [Bacteroidia bacterium]|nr:helix-turn-helix domain-containing protein [Bacteroidia bacterium]
LDEISQKDDLKKDQKDLLIAIMKQIENDDRVTQNALVSATGKVRATVQKYLQYLVENKYICRVGSDKGGRWKIVNNKSE